MADLIIKPATGDGNKLILQDKAGGAVLTTADSGATITSAILGSNISITPGTAPGSPTEGSFYFDSTWKQILVYHNSTWNFSDSDQKASGGEISLYNDGSNDFVIHTFLRSSKFKLLVATDLDILVVGGGGASGSGNYSGSGGGGGVRYWSRSVAQGNGAQAIAAGTHAILVGAGGTLVNTPTSGRGGNGGDSRFGSLTVVKGGGGGGNYGGGGIGGYIGNAGGCGGGAGVGSWASTVAGGAGHTDADSYVQGYAGGAGLGSGDSSYTGAGGSSRSDSSTFHSGMSKREGAGPVDWGTGTQTMDMDGSRTYYGGGAAGAVYPSNNGTGKHTSGGGGIGYSINDGQEHVRFGTDGINGRGGGGAGGAGSMGMGEDTNVGGTGIIQVRYLA
jgi:hypothetical protein